MLAKFEGRRAKSLPGYRGLTVLFQMVPLGHLIEQDDDNILRILDSIKSGSRSQRCGENQSEQSWWPPRCHESGYFPWLALLGCS